MSEARRLAAIKRWSSPEERLKQGERMRGKIPWIKGKNHSAETIRKISLANIGYKHSEETRRKMSIAKIGYVPWNKGMALPYQVWNKGTAVKTTEAIRLRRNKKYYAWRVAVFERDNYTCRICGACGVRLNADHIKKFADFPALRYALSNGRTLCENCHRKTPNYGNRKGTI